MDIFYLVLLITTISMTAILTQVFFDAQLKNLLGGHLYSRAFTLMTVVTVAGIVWATTLSFTARHEKVQAMVVNNNPHKP
jgi:hypothetical protein